MTYNELEVILLDTEINLTNFHLTYAEGYIQLIILTPKSMILGGDVSMINFIADKDSDEWIKRQKDAQQCKEKAWKR